MGEVETYLWVSLGVGLSVLIPILRRYIPSAQILGVSFASENAGAAGEGHVWQIARPYVMLGLFSLAVSIIIVAAGGDNIDEWGTAVLAGYGFDSTLQKLKGGG